jgi:putative phosphoesterase
VRLGILSDTHDEIARTQLAVRMLQDAGAEALVHCGDLACPEIVQAIAALPSWFTFGNHDADVVPALQRAATEYGPVCLGWGGVIECGGRRMGVAHGHMTIDIRRVLRTCPELLLTGHSHLPSDSVVDGVRRICPGALHRADTYTVALLDLASDVLQWLRVDD